MGLNPQPFCCDTGVLKKQTAVMNLKQDRVRSAKTGGVTGNRGQDQDSLFICHMHSYTSITHFDVKTK